MHVFSINRFCRGGLKRRSHAHFALAAFFCAKVSGKDGGARNPRD